MNERNLPISCPDCVVRAGTRLVEIRMLAEKLEDAIDKALPDIREAIGHVVEKHGARRAQAGESLALLRQAQATPGNIAHAHDVLRLVLVSKGIAEPTDAQIVSTMTEKAAPDVEIESIR